MHCAELGDFLDGQEACEQPVIALGHELKDKGGGENPAGILPVLPPIARLHSMEMLSRGSSGQPAPEKESRQNPCGGGNDVCRKTVQTAAPGEHQQRNDKRYKEQDRKSRRRCRLALYVKATAHKLAREQHGAG